MTKLTTNFHHMPNGAFYAWIDLAGRSFGVTYTPGRFDGFFACDVYNYVTEEIRKHIRAEYARNPNSFRRASKEILDEILDA